jgi:hypothetical protein
MHFSVHTCFHEIEADIKLAVRIAPVTKENGPYANARTLLYRRNRYMHLVTDHGDLRSSSDKDEENAELLTSTQTRSTRENQKYGSKMRLK